MFDNILPFALDKQSTVEQIASIPDSASAGPTSSDAKTSPSSSEDNTARKRKAHKKSRRGCENCKLRRVKCDEARPKCQKCLTYGVDCSYDAKTGGLKFAGESSFSVEKPAFTTAPRHGQMLLGALKPSGAPASKVTLDCVDNKPSAFNWLPSDLEVMADFQSRTVLTVGTKSTAKLYQNEIFKLATHYPFLTHVVLTLTLMHERHLTGTVTIGIRATMHWLQGTALFKEALIKPECQTKRDALWASAAILGCIQFASIEARTPQEAWPLKGSSSDDLDWLKMSDGKKAVWRIADITNPASVFNKMKGHPDLYRPMVFDVSDMGNVTREFIDVFDLGPSSNTEDNPYHDAAIMLARLLPIECDSNTILEFLMFMSRIHPKLKALLEQKDPKALLLVACWYAKIFKFQWWIHRRGLLEGTAICIYLDRYYSHAKSIQRLLLFPKLAFGLTFESDWHNLVDLSAVAAGRILEVSG